MRDVCVIGLGNTLAGDDGVGVAAARHLARMSGLQAEVCETDRPGVDLVDLLRGRRAVVLIDAVRSGRDAGAIHRIDVSAAPFPAPLMTHSTHAFGLAGALELARALGVLPPTVIVYGIEADSASVGAALSPAVAAALPALVRRILADAARLITT